MSPRSGPLRALLVICLLLVPLAQGHGGEVHDETGASEPSPITAPSRGYTGPGNAPYITFYEGVWLYGQSSATPLAHQDPRHMRGDGDWIVWEDARRGDIFLYSISGGTGHYLQADRALQRNPEISGNVVVYEDYRRGRSDVYAYFISTGETRLLSSGFGNHRVPKIHGDLVAWEDDRHGNGDIYGHNLANATEFPIHVGPDKESDPLVLHGVVYFRTYRFNVWDIMAHDVARGETFAITTDTEIQTAPFTNGQHVYFLTQWMRLGWKLQKYDTRLERVVDTPIRTSDTSHIPAHGHHIVQLARDVGHAQLIARNLTTGDNTHVSGNLVLTTEPHLRDGTIFASVVTANGTSLLTLKVSPFAWAKRPTLTITQPGGITPWLRPITATGLLNTGPGWTEPTTFTYRINNGPPHAIPPGERWRITLDPNGVEPGNHVVTFRATFREGPPVESSIMLIVPAQSVSIDAEQAGVAFHSARVLGDLNHYILANPASWFLIPLAIFLLALLLYRVWLVVRPKKSAVRIEYVAPDEA